MTVPLGELRWSASACSFPFRFASFISSSRIPHVQTTPTKNVWGLSLRSHSPSKLSDSCAASEWSRWVDWPASRGHSFLAPNFVQIIVLLNECQQFRRLGHG